MYNFKNPSVLLIKVRSITLVKIDLIQAKIKKVKGHQVHRQNSKYWMPKIVIKNNFYRPENIISLV